MSFIKFEVVLYLLASSDGLSIINYSLLSYKEDFDEKLLIREFLLQTLTHSTSLLLMYKYFAILLIKFEFAVTSCFLFRLQLALLTTVSDT